jgi:hypothetical protein
MKRFHFSPASLFSFLLLPFLFLFIKRKRKSAIFYLLLVCFIGPGCFQRFYRTNTKTSINDSTLSNLKNNNKYYIVHLKSGDYALKDISINNNMLTAGIGQINQNHMSWLDPAPGSSPSYKKADKDYVLNEIHIYALNQNIEDSTHISIPVSSITRVDMYEMNISKTNTNRAISITAAIVIPVGIIVALAAVACNCPQVYAYDGSQYQFKSGVFSGAIYSSLEKTDYLPLVNLKNVDGKFMFRVMNNQQEEQYINQLQLINVRHDATTHVLLDRNGLIHTYQQPIAPMSTSLKNDEAGQTFKIRDGNTFIFNQKADTNSDFGNVILTFDKPADTKQAKLIVNAKNSLWAGYIFEEFSALFGDQFQKYQAKQDKTNKQKIERWQKEQALSLMVYVETDKGWQLADYFPTTGNTAGRDMVMAVNIPETKQNKIRIKLESAFMFWELDYIAMDFSSDVNLKPEFINVSSAAKSKISGDEVVNVISKDDQYSKLLQDEYLSVEFNSQETIEIQNSYFLVSTGYYHSLKQYAGRADISKLNQFKKKGSFSVFSENKFTETQKLLAKGIDLRTEPKK